MKERALALFLLALALFTPPLALFPLGDKGPWGLPSLYLYLYLAWGLVILLAYLLYREP
ncbi:hypothetical protein [uncultured Thermus sp.]|uniref:hypothetical protein n=1 Tax=uncultured Thermus sp. TaxID=157149 RepID=UPI00260C7CC8|nr:hypothetical protein [uncultured Thermus sp.]